MLALPMTHRWLAPLTLISLIHAACIHDASPRAAARSPAQAPEATDEPSVGAGRPPEAPPVMPSPEPEPAPAPTKPLKIDAVTGVEPLSQEQAAERLATAYAAIDRLAAKNPLNDTTSYWPSSDQLDAHHIQAYPWTDDVTLFFIQDKSAAESYEHSDAYASLYSFLLWDNANKRVIQERGMWVTPISSANREDFVFIQTEGPHPLLHIKDAFHCGSCCSGMTHSVWAIVRGEAKMVLEDRHSAHEGGALGFDVSPTTVEIDRKYATKQNGELMWLRHDKRTCTWNAKRGAYRCKTEVVTKDLEWSYQYCFPAYAFDPPEEER